MVSPQDQSPKRDIKMNDTVNLQDRFRQLLFKAQAKHGYLSVMEVGMRDFIEELCSHFADKVTLHADSWHDAGVTKVKSQLHQVTDERNSVYPL